MSRAVRLLFGAAAKRDHSVAHTFLYSEKTLIIDPTMAWSDQQYQVPQNVQPNMPGGSMPPAGAPLGSAAPTPGYYGANPLQGPAAPTPMQNAPMPQAPSMGNPAMQAGQSPLTAMGLPAGGQAPASATSLDDDKVALDDVEWVNRAKRVIGGTQGDPHRQVQLIQHLRSQYLKNRFGRTVHTDEG
jgi:hypothetical protein